MGDDINKLITKNEIKPVTLSSIPTWKQYFIENLPRPVFQDRPLPTSDVLNGKVSVWSGDITLLKLDAIVNATNVGLTANPTGSVGWAVHNKAGPQLRTFLQQFSGFNTGKAIISPGFDLFADYVIHTSSPVINADENGLAKCYQNCLNLLVEMGLRTIAFPCVGTGACRYPQAEAAHIAIRETWNFLRTNHEKVDRIVFCTFLPEDKFIYDTVMQRYFPVENLI